MLFTSPRLRERSDHIADVIRVRGRFNEF